MAIRTRVNSDLIDLTFQGKPIKKVITGQEVVINHPAIPDTIDTVAMSKDTIFYSMSDGGNYNNGYEGAMSVGVTYTVVSINPTNKSAIFDISITVMGDFLQGLPQDGQVMLEVLTSFVEINGSLNMNESQGWWEISGSVSNKTISFTTNAWNLIFQKGSPAWDETVVEERVVYQENDTYKWVVESLDPYEFYENEFDYHTTEPITDFAMPIGEGDISKFFPPTKTFLNKTVKVLLEGSMDFSRIWVSSSYDEWLINGSQYTFNAIGFPSTDDIPLNKYQIPLGTVVRVVSDFTLYFKVDYDYDKRYGLIYVYRCNRE